MLSEKNVIESWHCVLLFQLLFNQSLLYQNCSNVQLILQKRLLIWCQFPHCRYCTNFTVSNFSHLFLGVNFFSRTVHLINKIKTRGNFFLKNIPKLFFLCFRIRVVVLNGALVRANCVFFSIRLWVRNFLKKIGPASNFVFVDTLWKKFTKVFSLNNNIKFTCSRKIILSIFAKVSRILLWRFF